jgi:photosystem II stability/assembly factor-like uncharacterized protein
MRILIVLFFAVLQTLQAQQAIPLKAEEIFSGIKARQIGPALMSGRITDLEIHPSDSRIIYAGTAGGGVWQSTNGGVSFNPIFDKHIQSIGCVRLSPHNPDREIWVGTGETWTRNSVSLGDGIYKSSDGGQNWQHMGLANSERISDIIIHPQDNQVVYVGVLGKLWSDSEERGIYKSSDSGKNWEKIFFVNKETGCSELVMDPSNPDILYASFWQFRRTAYSFESGGEHSGLYKSIDGGKTWAKIHNGFPEGKLGRIALAVAPSLPNRLYAVLETENEKDKGLYRSDDGGNIWKQTSSDFELVVRPFYFSRLVVDPKNPDILLKAGLSGYISKDGGYTFRSIGGGIHSDLHDFVFDPKDSQRLYVGTDGGVYRSWDGGTVWDMVKGLPVSQYYHVSTDNQNPYRIYGGLQDNGSWVGPSQKPGGIENRDWISVGFGDGFRVYPHPVDPNIVYSEMQGAENIWRVDLNRNTYKTIKPNPEKGDPKLRFNWNAPLTTSLHFPDRLYVGSQFIHVSDNQGESWRKLSPDLTSNDPLKQQQEKSGGLSIDNSGAENHCTIFTINESPIDKNIIWAGTDDGLVQLTTDGGLNWKNVTPPVDLVPANTWVHFIEPGLFDPNSAYAVFDGHTRGDFTPYILKTNDLGKTWQLLSVNGIKGFARCIRQDHINQNVLFLGTEEGLYISVDGGLNWAHFENNLPPVSVHYLTIQKEADALVLATHGRGVVIIDNLNPIRSITSELLSKDLEFISTKPTIIYEKNSFGSYSSPGEYVGPNPSSAAQIIYFLGKRHTLGKMTLEIFDSSGNKVAELAPGKSKGINIVEWSYTRKPPKTAKAKTFALGGLFGGELPEGSYEVKITKGNKEFRHTIQLQYDPNSIHTKEERDLKHASISQLYSMSEKLAWEVNRLDSLESGLYRIKDQISDKKILKKLGLDLKIISAENLRKKMVVTTGDNYVGTAEPELREKIAALFGEVAAYAGRPSNAQLESLKDLNTQLKEVSAENQSLIEEIDNLIKNNVLKTHPDFQIAYLSMEDFLKLD